MTTAVIILAILIVLFGIVFLALWYKTRQIEKQYPNTHETHTVSKDDDFQTILEKFNVPAEYYKIVISQARTYNVINCPAVIWKANDKIKVLVLKSQPFVAEEEWEDFLYIASSPFVNFKQFDGTEFPDWASQSEEIKRIFSPYVEMTVAPGGIDRTRQQYWAGTICVYAPSLAEIFKMMGKPLSDYEISVDNIKRMREDGSVPREMIAQYKADMNAAKDTSTDASSADTEALWEAIRRLEQENKELQKKLESDK